MFLFLTLLSSAVMAYSARIMRFSLVSGVSLHEITLVSHFSIDRALHFTKTVDDWNGVISIAMYATNLI